MPTIRVICAWCSAEWRKPWPVEDDEPTHSMCDTCAHERGLDEEEAA